MKKILLPIIIVLLVTSVFAMSSCSSSNPLNKMSVVWNSTEIASYRVYNVDPDSEGNESVSSIGKLEMTVKTILDPQDVKIGKGDMAVDMEPSMSYFSQLVLTIDGEGENMISQALFDTKFRPKASYRKTTFKDSETGKLNTFEYLITYNTGNKAKASYASKLTKNGEEPIEKSGEISLKGNAFDNEALYVAVRASRPENAESLTFNVVSVETNKLENFTLSATQTKTLKYKGADCDCFRVNIAVSNDYTPTNYECYVAKEPTTFRVGAKDVVIDKPIIKIREGDYYYKLDGFTSVVED